MWKLKCRQPIVFFRSLEIKQSGHRSPGSLTLDRFQTISNVSALQLLVVYKVQESVGSQFQVLGENLHSRQVRRITHDTLRTRRQLTCFCVRYYLNTNAASVVISPGHFVTAMGKRCCVCSAGAASSSELGEGPVLLHR